MEAVESRDEKAHLVDEAGDAFDAVGHGGFEADAKFGVLVAFLEELLVGGKRDEGIADFVGEAVGHGGDEAEVGGLEFEFCNCSDWVRSSAISRAEAGQGGAFALERNDADVVNGAGGILRLVAERGDGGAGFQDLEDLAAEGGRDVAELEIGAAGAGLAEIAAGRFCWRG